MDVKIHIRLFCAVIDSPLYPSREIHEMTMVQPLINITRRHALIFSAYLVFYEFLTYIANDMIMPGMIQVVETFHGSGSAVATSLTVYILGGASLQIFLGPISDRYGRRPVMMCGLTLFFLCTLFIASSQSMEQFLTARFFQGMGLCFISVIGYATLQEIFAEVDAVRLIAIMANVSILAPLVGPLLGAIVIHYYGWRIIFWGIAALTLIAFWGLWRFMPEPVGQIKRDGEEIKRVSLSLTTVFQNYKTLMSNRAYMLGTVASGMVGIPCLAWIALSPVILIANAKLSVLQYGVWQLPIFGASILGNLFLIQLTKHYPVKTILMIGSCLLFAGLFLAYFLPALHHGDYIWLMPGMIVYFLGLGVAYAPLERLVLFATPVSKGTASALMTMGSTLTWALGIEVGNLIYSTGNNLWFGLFCVGSGMVYFVFVLGAFFVRHRMMDESLEAVGPVDRP